MVTTMSAIDSPSVVTMQSPRPATGRRLIGSRRPGGRSAATSVTEPALGGSSDACGSHKCRLATHAWGRCDPTVATAPGPSVKTRTEGRCASSQRTSTRTCFPLAAVRTTPAHVASLLAVICGLAIRRSGSSEHARARCWCLVVRCANALQAMPHARKARIHRSPTALLRESGSRSRAAAPLVQLGRLEHPCQAPAFVVVQGSAPLSLVSTGRGGGRMIGSRQSDSRS